ncbi:unnamed protein product [Cuscuta campestris]|uniref:Uncharacterized protein n=1 Tax=Cuscuta campestris TaxID=132261 RepID=A0A484LCZ5_9ASTE|nr:unnamed protein product [Cuscuta campestris]
MSKIFSQTGTSSSLLYSSSTSAATSARTRNGAGAGLVFAATDGSGGGSGPAAFIQPFPFLEKRKKPAPARTADPLGFCMGLGTACSPPREPPPVPRDFLPVHPPARRPLRFRWRPGARVPEPGLLRGPPGMWLDKNQRPAEEEHAGAAPPSLKMGISDLRTGVLGMKDNCDGGGSGGNGDGEMERGGCSSQLMRGSDEEENGGGTKHS